ncbi:DUF4261 domain-containing protein [Nocardia arthritidis]|uniref:DUF4261 domain-containing protein n=1 Tax=Nocardia arthritidis TaxID=228602 RepID=A0A6G9YSZ0_9NOCA|nr:DUF4261 domain-containing protein [Nocardia arthritidis]QIS16435.1 DUF4261 domain-containing protein [Nocardia arthritidis]
MTGNEILVYPRHVLCVLGSGLDLDAIESRAEKAGFELDREFSEAEPDPRMADAFESCLAAVSFTEADWAAVEDHDTVAYLISRPIFPFVAIDAARWALDLTADLLKSGATAVKNESNGLAHGRDQWLEFADDAADDDTSDVALYYAWVKRPIVDDDVYYSCGMHLLGLPDIEIEPRDAMDPQELARLIDELALYLLTEERAQEMRDGAGFRLAEDAPRWILRQFPCARYEEDDFYFNPYGYWRLTPAP